MRDEPEILLLRGGHYEQWTELEALEGLGNRDSVSVGNQLQFMCRVERLADASAQASGRKLPVAKKVFDGIGVCPRPMH